MQSVLINLSLFKAGWLASVFTAAASVPAAGATVVAVVVAVHLLRADDVRRESRVLLIAALLGLGWESLLVNLDVVDYSVGTFLPGVAPYWIVGMWILFATTLNTSMRWLQNNLAIAAVFGAFGGPLSFIAGEKAGAVSFPDAQLSLFVIAAGWALLLPLMVRIASPGPERENRQNIPLERESQQ